VLPRRESDQAVAHALKNWATLTRCLKDGELCVDNNHNGRSLRVSRMGRHNWTLVGSDRGSKTLGCLALRSLSAGIHVMDSGGLHHNYWLGKVAA